MAKPPIASAAPPSRIAIATPALVSGVAKSSPPVRLPPVTPPSLVNFKSKGSNSLYKAFKP